MRSADHIPCTYKASAQSEFACELLKYLTMRSADHIPYIYKASAQNEFARVL